MNPNPIRKAIFIKQNNISKQYNLLIYLIVQFINQKIIKFRKSMLTSTTLQPLNHYHQLALVAKWKLEW